MRRVLLSHVDLPVLRADRVRADEHSFEHSMGFPSSTLRSMNAPGLLIALQITYFGYRAPSARFHSVLLEILLPSPRSRRL